MPRCFVMVTHLNLNRMFFRSAKVIFNSIQCVNRLNHTWTLPEGYRTPIYVYNCISKQKEPLIIKNKHVLKWYSCGPTVYDVSHIGHASCYIKLDIIQRILTHYFKVNLITCMNITDIDDKIILKSKETGLHYKEIAKKYENDFWEDLASLGISRPDIVVRVTENIELIIDFIKKLEDMGIAYKGKDNSVYFDVSKGCRQYGKLQNIAEPLQDTRNPCKKSSADFALWKHKVSNNEPSFESPWGTGRPGWHIECSALATYIFGDEIDIHAGGIDLRFPHHENEEAQSCAFHEKPQWVNYWIHTGHLHLKNSEKMSKSLKNTISIQDMLKNTSSDVFRLSCAISHYSSPTEYSSDLLEISRNIMKTYKNFITTCENIESGLIKITINNDVLCQVLEASKLDISKAFCDDFNTPLVIETLSQMVSKINCVIHAAPTPTIGVKQDMCYLLTLKKFLNSTLNILGLNIQPNVNPQNVQSSEIIEMLVNFRKDIRNIGLSAKNTELLEISDKIRNDLRKVGVNVKDFGKQTSWST